MDKTLIKVRKIVKDREACCTTVHGVKKRYDLVIKKKKTKQNRKTEKQKKESQMKVFDYSKMMTF